MSKRVAVGALAAVAGIVLIQRAAAHCGSMDFEKRIERMPEGSPRKWMFRNISAIRENTDRMRELLEAEHDTSSRVPVQSS